MRAKFHSFRIASVAAVLLLSLVPAGAALDPAAIAIKLPADLVWTSNAEGAQIATLFGDASKPGLYIQLVRWPAGHMSRPHFHANDRYITVISGTWWVGTGPHFDPNSTVAVPTGSYVTHTGKQVHYDGAKEADVLLQITGMGPGTAIPAEEK